MPTKLDLSKMDGAPPTKRANVPKAWVKLAILQPAACFYQVKKDSISVGRSRSCDVILNDSRISSVHCKIYKGVELEDGSFQMVVEDTSFNGTKVQRAGQEIIALSSGEKETLQHGDMVYLLLDEKKTKDCISFRIDHCDTPAIVEDDEDENGAATGAAAAAGKGGGGGGGKGLAFGKYRLLKNLGSGSFAQVKLAFDVASNSLVALKFIDKQHFFNVIHTSRPEARTAEVDLLKQIRHDNVVAFLGEHHDEEHIVLVLEYVSGGELFDHICDNGRMTEPDAKNIFRQMVDAIAYLHTKGIVHRDLKPENILLHTKLDGSLQIKITDFGLSRLIPEGSFMQSVAGSPGYYAPEVMLDASSAPGYTKKVDIWSLGVILYILLSGVPPYDPQLSNHEIARRSIRFPMPHFAGVSQQAKDLILKCLEVNAERRPSATQLQQHPWVSARQLRRLASEGVGSGGGSAGSMAPPITNIKRKRQTEM